MISSSQKTLKKYGPLRTNSEEIVSFREIKIGLRSSENGALQNIDCGWPLYSSTSSSLSSNQIPSKNLPLDLYFFSGGFQGKKNRITELGERECQSLSLCWGGPPPTL